MLELPHPHNPVRWVVLTSFYKFIHSYLLTSILETYHSEHIKISAIMELTYTGDKKKKSKFAACRIVLSGMETRKKKCGREGGRVLF